MKTRTYLQPKSPFLIAIVSLLSVTGALAFTTPTVEHAPNVADRAPATEPDAASGLSPEAAEQLEAFAAASGSQAAFYVDPDTGSVRAIYAVEGALSEPIAGSAETVAWAFLKTHQGFWNARATDLSELEVTRVFDSPSGLTHVHFLQHHDGWPVFNGETRVHVDGAGRVMAIHNGLRPNLGELPAMEIDATEAVRLAALDIGRDPATLPAVPVSGGFRVKDEGDPMGFGLRAEPVVFATDDGGRPAWSCGVGLRGASAAYYNVVIDAISGKVLARVNRVAYVDGLAFTGPNPPMAGGCPVGPAQSVVSFDPTAQSPDGFVGPPLSGTLGNNLRSQEDTRNEDFGAVAPPTAAGQWRHVFTNSYAMVGNPAPDRNAAITNLFYMNNYIHDRLYSRGFDEPSGNFQVQNFGNGGAPMDEVWADAQDGAGLNNANFGTDVDGVSPRMQMFLWTGPNRDGDFDNTVIVHEYGHGVSHRLLGVNCLGGVEAGAMGEGWGDALACSFFDIPVVGAYATNNCTRGVRSQSYDTATFSKTYASVCNGGCQVHRDGEVWAGTLWRMRENLAARVGNRALAACIHETLIIEGMKLTTCNPTMLQARDGILAAARQTHPEYVCDIWAAFANRGMGVSATSTGGTGPTARSEAFNLPPECPCPVGANVTGLVSNTTTPNQIRLTWNPVAGAVEYRIYVSDGDCGQVCAPSDQTLLATVPTTNFTDMPLSGDVSRTYTVRAAFNGQCVSPPACVKAQPTGRCTVSPRFTRDENGVTQIVPSAIADPCELTLHWSPAESLCPSAGVVYNVYRSTMPTFTPSLANLIATVPGPATSHVDADNLMSGTTYYYIVRAEDTTTGGPGPNGGNEDTNLIRRASVPRGLPTGTALRLDSLDPSPMPGWTTAVFPATAPGWTVVTDANSGGTNAWRTQHAKGVDHGTSAVIQDLVLPPVSITSTSQLVFDHKMETEAQWDGGVVELSTDGGLTWNDLGAFVQAPRGYNDLTFSMVTFLAQGATNRIWTGTIGFAAFQRVTVDLAAFAPMRDALIRFRALWDYDSPAGTFRGWYIDNVQITNHEQFGMCSSTAPCVVTPDAVALGPTRYCVGDSVVLDASGSILTGCTGSAQYEWFQDATSIPGATAATYMVPTTLPAGSYRYEVEVTCSTDPVCSDRSAPIQVDIDTTDRVSQLLAIKSVDDVDMSWDVDPAAAGGYHLYKTIDKTLIPTARLGAPGVDPVGATAPDPLATMLTDVGAVPGPPVNEALWHYQALSVCIDGVTEGPN